MSSLIVDNYFVLEEKHLQPMALKDRREGDAVQLARVNDYNKELKEHITDFRAEHSDNVREFFLHNKEVDGTLAKLVITDGAGQHKNNKNIGRGTTKKIEAQTVDFVEQKAKNTEVDILDMI